MQIFILRFMLLQDLSEMSFRNLKTAKTQHDHLFLNSDGVNLDYLTALKRFIINKAKKNYQFIKMGIT